MILSAVRKFQPRVLYSSPYRLVLDERDTEGYVDDSNQGVNYAGVKQFYDMNTTNHTLGDAALQAKQAFERYLSMTGGGGAINRQNVYLYHRHRDKRK